MSDGADLLKYVTIRVATYWETPKAPEDRRERRQKREPWVTRWFGQLLPVGIGMMLGRGKETGGYETGKTGPGADRSADYV